MNTFLICRICHDEGDKLYVKTAEDLSKKDELKPWTTFEMTLREEQLMPDPNECKFSLLSYSMHHH
jgi:hypothetical protein